MQNDNFTLSTTFAEPTTAPAASLREVVLHSINHFFEAQQAMGALHPGHLQSFVLEQVEAAMYESVMKFTKGNQVKAAKVLGVSRGTLRTKLKRYFNTTHVGGVYHSWQHKSRKAPTLMT